MARLAPAACSPCAIAHAIERLFATPKTTAVRPFKSSTMRNAPGTKSIRIAGDEVPYDAVPCVPLCSPVSPVVKALLGERNKYAALLRRRRHSLLSTDRPAGAAKRDRIHHSNYAKPRRQADPRRDPPHRQPQRHL